MGKLTTLLLIVVLLVLPIQDRMRTWKRKFKHPDPIYLSTQIPSPELDTKPRYFKYDVYGFSSGKCIIIWTGKDAWRPDPSAQVDELKADFSDEARKEP